MTMTMPKEGAPEATRVRPEIVLTAEDHARLTTLANAAMDRMPDLASALAEELDRARVLASGAPDLTVRMGSEVAFREEATGKVHNVTLVYPPEADIAASRISVLTPVGTALVGMRVGASIDWETPNGEPRRLTVIDVRDPKPSA
jgi:regulator of nucleoside diphosphate kinase